MFAIEEAPRKNANAKEESAINYQAVDKIHDIMLLTYVTVPEEILLNLPHLTKKDIEIAKEELLNRWIKNWKLNET